MQNCDHKWPVIACSIRYLLDVRLRAASLSGGTCHGATTSIDHPVIKRDRGRQETFNKLFDQHWTRVQHHVECLVENEADAAEIVAEVFTVAWKKLKAADPMGLTWLLRTADNKIDDRERNQGVRARAMDALRSEAAARRSAADALNDMAVRQAMDAVLSRREHQIVSLFYWDRLTAGEISEIVGSSHAVVWTTLSRAREKLRPLLTGSDDDVRATASRKGHRIAALVGADR